MRRTIRFYFKLCFLLSAFILITIALSAQWSHTEPLSLSSGLHPNIVSDGAGGQIVADYTVASINMVKLNSAGVGQWTAAIIPIVSPQLVPVAMTTDGAGGVIVAWTASDNDNNIYAQRINSNGETQWTSPRVAVCVAEGDQVAATIVSDGQGGAIICWYDYRDGNGKGVYAQRLNAAGVAQWATGGVVVTPLTDDYQNVDEYGPAMSSNGAGEAAIAWTKITGSRTDIVVQRLNTSGTPLWPVAGVKLTTSSGTNPFVLNDGSGGNIIVWKSSVVRAQRINAAGAIQWTAGGKTVSTASGRPFATSDESGGAFITWISAGVHAQRINDQGTSQWAQDAILCVSNQTATPLVITDGAGGCIVSWFDYRSNVNYQVFAQRLNGSGIIQWQANGAYLYPQLMTQLNPVISSNGAQGAVVAWNNSPGSGGATFAQNINSNGTIGPLQTAPPCNWTGAMNSDWENAANWSDGTIPGSGSDVIINNGTVVINSNVTVRTLKVMPASSLTVSPGQILKVLH